MQGGRGPLLVLPELCITGYTCGELFIQQSLLDAATAGLKRVVKATVGKQMIVIVGVPLSSFGKLYNCAAVIYEGEILGVVPNPIYQITGVLRSTLLFTRSIQ